MTDERYKELIKLKAEKMSDEEVRSIVYRIPNYAKRGIANARKSDIHATDNKS